MRRAGWIGIIAIVTSCGAPAKPAPAKPLKPTPPPMKVVAIDHPLYCFASHSITVCETDEPACAAARGALNAPASCQRAETATCYDVPEAKRPVCSRTTAECLRSVEMLARSGVTASTCYVLQHASPR